MTEGTPKDVDPERPEPRRPFDNMTGYSGQDYNREDARRLAAEDPGGRVNSQSEPRPGSPESDDSRDIPPDNGARAYIDPRNGEVHGSGVGAGAGSAGEDFDTGTPGAARSVSSTTGERAKPLPKY